MLRFCLTMNKKLLLKVRNRILRDPSCLNMEVGLEENGRVGCIAGLACLITKVKATGTMQIIYKGAQSLKLSRKESLNLLFLNGWNGSMRLQYEKSKTPKEKAKVTVKVIDKFIKMKERLTKNENSFS